MRIPVRNVASAPASRCQCLSDSDIDAEMTTRIRLLDILPVRLFPTWPSTSSDSTGDSERTTLIASVLKPRDGAERRSR
jgi:hypothetical protein